MFKRITSFLLTLCLILSLLGGAIPQANAAATYSVADAIAYAKAHWNDGVGLCAEFVSRCVRAGGLNIKVITTAGSCANAITNATGIGRVELKLNSKGYATKALNGSNLAEGDVVIQYCKTHKKAPHIIFCAGYDSSGIATYYAHNGAMNKGYYDLSTNLAYQHTAACDIVGQVLHISELDVPVPESVDVNWVNHYNTIGYTNAQLAATLKVSGTSINNVTKSGIDLYDGTGALVGWYWGTPVPHSSDGVIYESYDMDLDLQCALTRNARYYYQYRALVNGSVYKSEMQTFVTGPEGYVTITFDPDGGTCDILSMTIANFETFEEMPVPAREGYTFTGWYTNWGTHVTEEVYIGGGSQTLTAHWEPHTYTVTFDANGGTGGPVSQTKTHDVDLILNLNVPTREGYTFLGWGTSATATSPYFYPGGTYFANESDTLYAVWEKEAPKLAAPTIRISGNTTTGKPKVSWSAVDGANLYRVYRRASGESAYTRVKSTSSVSFTDTTAKAGTKYYYKVKAVDSATGITSAYSNVLSRMCDLQKPVVTLKVDTASGKPKVTFEKISGAEKYYIVRSTSEDGTYSKVATITGTSYIDTTAKAGTNYYYKVKALHAKDAADSAYSSVKNRVCDLAKPVVSITRSSGDPKVMWETVSGAEKYYVYRATSKDGTYTKVYTAKTARSYTDKDVTAGKTYYYKVKAIHSKSAANSAYSSVKYITAK